MNFSTISNSARRESVELLHWYLQNPGRFSILILGGVGVGKAHWVNVIQAEIKDKVPIAKGVVTISLGSALATKAYWEKVFSEAHGKILLIKELEKVKSHQHLLFEALSTFDGKYGFQEKEVETRVVFTSTYDISALRNTEDLISHRLFDRIAQLVVRFPAHHKGFRGIWDDFRATWEKMSFETDNELPGVPLQNWLEGGTQQLNGSFRDLDKIAILWHQFRLMKVDEEEILAQVLAQFQPYSSFPEPHTDLGDAFYFQKGKTKKTLEEEFRTQFKKWAITTYGNIRKAAGPLEMSPRTMEKW